MGFYEDMAAMTAEILQPDAQGGLGQGVVQLKRITLGEKPNDWTPAPEITVTYTLKAAVKRLNHRNINGTVISETGDEVIFADPGTKPLLSDIIVIDGAERAVDEVSPIPGAGTAAVWKIWSKA